MRLPEQRRFYDKLVILGCWLTCLASNDGWRTSQAADIIATGLQPHDERDPAIPMMIGPGNYTTVIRGKGISGGIALGEVYNVSP